MLGRIVYVLFWLHAAFYLNFFVGMSMLEKLISPVVVAGLVAFALFNLLNWSAISVVRQYSYRLFFISHLVAAFALPPIVFFHAHPARIYVVEALLVFIADLTSRKMTATTTEALVQSIPGTHLIKISASLPAKKANRFREHPGSHVYLSFPPDIRLSPKPLSLPFLYNPFTVAAVDDETGDITLVVRHRSGPTTSILAKFAGPSHGEGGDGRAVKMPVNIEGPYGAVLNFPNLAGQHFDRILLVAGGVGATFAVPIYRAILHDAHNAKVDLVWAVRGAGDATWAVEGQGAKSILSHDNVHIFLTGDILESGSASSSTGRSPGNGSGDVELNPLHRDRSRNRYAALHSRKRPDLKNVVDDAFKQGNEERVAVLVCGPDEMGREVREHVRSWVMRGRSAWFHNETFGW